MARLTKLNYDNPGTPDDIKCLKVNLSLKSKDELIRIIAEVAECCDMEGKGYVNQWENDVRKAIGYTRKLAVSF